MYYIGIDLGTSAVKLLLMQGDGQIANIVSREYPIAFPHPGWSEQNPADWWDAVCAGIPELLNGFAGGRYWCRRSDARPGGAGCTGQSDPPLHFVE